MTADLALRLRTLTQDYHDGKLNLTVYRQMRAALLDSLVANVANASAAAAVAVTQPRGGSWRNADAITRPGRPRVGPPDVNDAPSGSHPALKLASPGDSTESQAATQSRDSRGLPVRAIVVAVAVLAIAGTGFWLMRDHASSKPDSSGSAPSAAEQDRIHSLLTQFSDHGDWGDGHLAVLNSDLLELGGARISEASSEPWFQHFAEEVRQRLKEQQALASTPLTADNSPLAALAVTVGLDLNAPDAAIHISALPPPRAPEPVTSAPRSAKTTSVASVAQSASVSPPANGDTGSRAAPGAANEGSSGASADSSAGARSDVSARDGAAGPDASTRSASLASSAGTRSSAAVANATTRPDATASAVTQADTHEGACRLELIGTRRPLCHDLLAVGAEGPPLALVPAGAFEMGSTAAAEEQPVHHVTIREPFAISIYEVSQGEFKQFCEHTGRQCPAQPWPGDDYPVVNVTWDDARAYTAWLSNVTHHRYALPTEAQWEYAARAGRTGLFPSGDTLSPTDAQYSMLARQTAAARRSQKFNANAFRLLHTVGNVREWVEDAWKQNFAGAPADGSASPATQPAQRVVRGGSYTDGAARLRLSMREGLPAATRDVTTGFRIVRELP